MELIRLEDIHKTYYLGQVSVPVLRGVSLSIDRGELVALMGASGSGKTTLMNILGCLDRPTSGKYWLDGEEMSGLSASRRAVVRSEKVGFVFQNFNLLPRTAAIGNVVMPLDYAPHHVPRAKARQMATALLERVGLADHLRYEPSQMSGGQQQRVAIARALINHPMLLLADEPTGNLDSRTSVEILKMFQRLNAEGITIVLVTHDPQVASFARRVVRIADGMIASDEQNGIVTGIHIAVGEDPAEQPLRPHFGSDGDGSRAAPAALMHVARAVSASTETTVESEGRIMGRTKPAPTVERPTRQAASEPEIEQEPASVAEKSPERFRRSPVLFPATWRTALGALRRNKLRSALSALGVIIAVAAVIAMTEIGQGSKATLQNSIANMGANRLMVHSGSAATSGVRYGTGSAMTLTPQDAEEISRQCPAVAEVAPTVRARTQIVYGSRNWVPNTMLGTTPSYLAVAGWGEMAEGEMFTDRDVRNANKVCVIGQTVRRNLFENESPIGKNIRINNVPFRVVGVLGLKGANMMGMDQDDVVLAPWTTIKFRVSGTTLTNTNQSASASSSSSSSSESVNTIENLYPPATSPYLSRTASESANTPQPVRFINIDSIQVKAASAEEIPAAIEQITALLRERHRLKPGDEDDFYVRDMTEMTNMLTSTSETISTLLLVVALISLVVGGVGIMNIMLVSVTERTREIGLRMAVGAKAHHILRQFLVESIVLCLFGGGLGILLGRGASLLVRSLMQWPTEASLPAIAAAVVVSVGVGVIFGFYPAWKAARLDPIEALRYE